jgi:hypothetical protein
LILNTLLKQSSKRSFCEKATLTLGFARHKAHAPWVLFINLVKVWVGKFLPTQLASFSATVAIVVKGALLILRVKENKRGCYPLLFF